MVDMGTQRCSWYGRKSVPFFLSLLCCLAVLRWYSRGSRYQYSAVREKHATSADPAVPATPSVTIAVNHESSYVHSDIANVVHVPSESRIEIHLKEKSVRRCQNPVFKGRLSGWSLSLIDFNFKFNDEQLAPDIVVGTYDLSLMPVSGKYFVEIIVLLCEGYGKGSRAVNLKEVCLEDVENAHNRITAGNGAASIEIVVDAGRSFLTQRRSNALESRGQWVHKSLLAQQPNGHVLDNTTNRTVPLVEPLYTRIQPRACNGIMYPMYEGNEDCEPFMSRNRFDAYAFHWNNGTDAILNEPGLGLLLPPPGGEPPKAKNKNVCFMGVSHSVALLKHCHKLLNETLAKSQQDGPLGLECSTIIIPFPRNLVQFNTSILDEQQCTHVVVGLFQWFFSFKQALNSNIQEITFSQWESQMITGIRKLENATKNSKSPLRKVSLRSAHPNGLKFQDNQCPPRDVRTPINAEGATTILQEIVVGFSSAVSMIDTSFIIGPVWDAAEDFSHYTHKEGEVETKFILAEILKEEQRQGA